MQEIKRINIPIDQKYLEKLRGNKKRSEKILFILNNEIQKYTKNIDTLIKILIKKDSFMFMKNNFTETIYKEKSKYIKKHIEKANKFKTLRINIHKYPSLKILSKVKNPIDRGFIIEEIIKNFLEEDNILLKIHIEENTEKIDEKKDKTNHNHQETKNKKLKEINTNENIKNTEDIEDINVDIEDFKRILNF